MKEPGGRLYAVGTVLFREGESSSEMYVLKSGKVGLEREVRGRKLHLLTMGPGEFFGEMAALNARPRSATATVLQEAELIAIDGSTIEAVLRANPDVALKMIRRLSARLERANEQLETVLGQDIHRRVVGALYHRALCDGEPDGIGIAVRCEPAELAREVACRRDEIEASLEKLVEGHLILRRPPNEVVIPELGRLEVFAEFLERAG
jgi:CRP-like cAMP-binding protein